MGAARQASSDEESAADGLVARKKAPARKTGKKLAEKQPSKAAKKNSGKPGKETGKGGSARQKKAAVAVSESDSEDEIIKLKSKR